MSATDFGIKLRRHTMIVCDPAKFPSWGVAYPSYRPGTVAVYPVLVKDMPISGRLAEIVRRRLGISSELFWPEW